MTRRLLTAVLAACLLSCGEPPDGYFGDKSDKSTLQSCLDVQLAKEGFTSASPAKLSLFFTVDTCDGRPVTGLDAQAFNILEDGKPVSVFESQQTIQPRGQKFRLYTLVLLDLSGSLLKSGEFPRLRDAAVSFVKTLLAEGNGHRVAVYGFDGRPHIFPVSGFLSNPDAVTQAIDALAVRECNTNADCSGFPDRKTCGGWLCVDDSTNLNGAVLQGLDRVDEELQAEVTIPFRHGSLVVFTDGTDQAARVSERSTRDRVKASPHRVFTVGLGGEVDEGVLRAYGKSGYHSAAQPEELEVAFGKVAESIAALASRFYLLEYCSPKRGGKHELEIRATSVVDGRPLHGALSHSFDATGFSSGCEIVPVASTAASTPAYASP